MAVTRTDREFQPIDALARALESGYELKLDRQLREHLEGWLKQWKLALLPEVDRPVDIVFNDDRREVVLVPGKTHTFRLTAEPRYRGATLELGGCICKLTYWDILDQHGVDYATRNKILAMLKNN